MKQVEPAVRQNEGNPNHHLWNNHGTFWCHLTVHLPDNTKRRLRLSLETTELTEARLRRDSLLTLFGVKLLSTAFAQGGVQ